MINLLEICVGKLCIGVNGMVCCKYIFVVVFLVVVGVLFVVGYVIIGKKVLVGEFCFEL